MTDKHPITPPPELLDKWDNLPLSPREIFVLAAQWGADQELDACCDWVSWWRCLVGGSRPEIGLRAARRPKPPSLKEQALKALSEMEDDCLMVTHAATIRNALESIDD